MTNCASTGASIAIGGRGTIAPCISGQVLNTLPLSEPGSPRNRSADPGRATSCAHAIGRRIAGPRCAGRVDVGVFSPWRGSPGGGPAARAGQGRRRPVPCWWCAHGCVRRSRSAWSCSVPCSWGWNGAGRSSSSGSCGAVGRPTSCTSWSIRWRRRRWSRRSHRSWSRGWSPCCPIWTRWSDRRPWRGGGARVRDRRAWGRRDAW